MLPRCVSLCHIICMKHWYVIKEKYLLKTDILSHSLYCLLVWDPSLSYYSLQWLQRMHNRAIRLCKYDHVSHHYQLPNWLPFELLILHLCVSWMNCSNFNVYTSGSIYCIWSHTLRSITVFLPSQFGTDCPLIRSNAVVKCPLWGDGGSKRLFW